MLKPEERAHVKKHIDKKLRNRMMIYFVMSVAILGFVVYELIIGSAPIRTALAAMVIGGGMGVLTHRIFLIYRHEDEKKVLSRVDRLGGVILVLYIAFSIFRSRIIGLFIPAPAVLTITMALVFGLMVGRVYGMRRRILKLLKENEVLG